MQDTILDSLSAGVYVVTAQDQGKVNGATVTWASQVAYDPPLVMVSLANIRVTHEMVEKSGMMGINVLSSDQVELARHFGFNTARDTDKFSDKSYSTSDNGLPILDGVKAYLECRIVSTFPAGEHTMFIGEVISAEMKNENASALLFKKEDFF